MPEYISAEFWIKFESLEASTRADESCEKFFVKKFPIGIEQRVRHLHILKKEEINTVGLRYGTLYKKRLIEGNGRKWLGKRVRRFEKGKEDDTT